MCGMVCARPCGSSRRRPMTDRKTPRQRADEALIERLRIQPTIELPVRGPFEEHNPTLMRQATAIRQLMIDRAEAAAALIRLTAPGEELETTAETRASAALMVEAGARALYRRRHGVNPDWPIGVD